MKAMGNQKPMEILQLEKELWQHIFSIAASSQSAVQALCSLQESWKNQKWRNIFGPTAKSFFSRCKLLSLVFTMHADKCQIEWIDYNSDISIYMSYISHPIPSTWFIPPAGHQYITGGSQIPSNDQPGSPSANSEDGVGDSDVDMDIDRGGEREESEERGSELAGNKDKDNQDLEKGIKSDESAESDKANKGKDNGDS